MEQGLQVAHGRSDDPRDSARSLAEPSPSGGWSVDYYKENEDEFSLRRVEPYALDQRTRRLVRGGFDPEEAAMRHFRLDRIRRAEGRRAVRATPGGRSGRRSGRLDAHRRGQASARRASGSPRSERAGRARAAVGARCADGAVVVELGFAGVEWLVREVLKEAGDAVVLEPEDAREAVLAGQPRACTGAVRSRGVAV